MNYCDAACDAPAAPPAMSPPIVPSSAPRWSEPAETSRVVAVFTFVLWFGCSTVAVLGFTLPYLSPQAPPAEPPPLTIEMLNVELSTEPLPEIAPAAAASREPPPPAEAVAPPLAPQPLAVALPAPAIAFAVPVEGPARIVAAAQASHTVSATRNEAPAPSAPPVQALTFGQGAGRQPAPDYPWRAQSEGQEGVVTVRFTVAESGRVAAAETVAASPWPLLNDSAVRTIRTRWRFPAGTPRAYEVAIRFVLPKS